MTISGGGASEDDVRGLEDSGSRISFDGSLKSVSISPACSECGVMALRLVGRLLRGSALVGTDSGPGSDIVVGLMRTTSSARVLIDRLCLRSPREDLLIR